VKRWLNAFRRAVGIVFLFLVLVLACVAIVLNTEAGSRFVVSRMTDNLPVEIEGVGGTLWRTLTVREFRYRNAAIDIRASSVEAALNWPSAIAGNLVLNRFRATSVDVRNLKPRPSEPRPLGISMPSSPIPVAVRNGAVGLLSVPGGDSGLAIGELRFRGASLIGSRVYADEFAAILFETAFSLTRAAVTLSGDVPVIAAVEWRRGDDWAGKGTLSGSLADLGVSHTLATPIAMTTNGTIHLQGRLQPSFELGFAFERIEAGSFSLRDANISVDGTIDDYQATFDLAVSEERLPDLRIRGDGNGHRDGLVDGRYTIETAAGTITASGPVSWQPSPWARLEAATDAFDAAMLDERLRGTLAARAGITFAGAADWQLGNATVEGELNGYTVGATGNLAASPGGPRCTSCTARISRTGERPLSAEARFDGTPGALEIDVTGRIGDAAAFEASGSLAASAAGVGGTVSRAAIEEPFTGRSVLATPLTFLVGGGVTTVSAHRWVLPEGRIDLEDITLAPDRAAVVASMSGLPLALLNGALPFGMHLGGTASGNVDLRREDGAWQGTVAWAQQGTTLGVDRPGRESVTLRFPEATAQATFLGNEVTATSTVRIDPGVVVSTTARVVNVDDDPQVDARFDVSGDRWDWVTALVPELDELGGDIAATVTAAGPLEAPDIEVDWSWRNGAAVVPALNVPLTEIDLSLTGDARKSITIAGKALAGGGPVQVAGSIDNAIDPSRTIRIKLTGERAELVNWPEYHLWATPDLAITGAAGGWDATGALGVPKAEIDVRRLPEHAVTVSGDVRTTDEHFSTTRGEAVYSGEAKVTLGRNVHVSAFGLDTRLEGELTVRQAPGQELRAEGRVTLVDGKFEAYGQKLRIESGTLTFTGPLDDPIVDLRAIRRIEEFGSTIVAGIHLQGRAQSLSSTVYAEPAMSEADALSYLVIGRPLAQATDTEGNQLSNTAVNLGIRGAARITQEIGQSIGLDELTIIGGGGDATALVAGKQVNSRLYARYAYGVFSRLGMILIRYRLTENLSLEAGAGESQSIDILYSIDKQ